MQVEGIILRLSCHKHQHTRLSEFSLPKSDYNGWKVIYVIGNLFLNSYYELDNNIMYIKCEDSYLHLLKKLVLAIKYLYQIYDIKQGILRCGDDLYWNEDKLIKFLDTNNKPDYLGHNHHDQSYEITDINVLKETVDDYHMVNYYMGHLEDFKNPLHNLDGINLIHFVKRPRTDIGARGDLYYISNKSCQILLNQLESIEFNIFHFDEFSQSYPYLIEDCSVSFILYFHRIKFTNDSNLVSCNAPYHELSNYIAISNDKYK